MIYRNIATEKKHNSNEIIIVILTTVDSGMAFSSFRRTILQTFEYMHVPRFPENKVQVYIFLLISLFLFCLIQLTFKDHHSAVTCHHIVIN